MMHADSCRTPVVKQSSASRKNIDSMLRVLARRPVGRQAILKSPTVVRTLTQIKRQANATCRLSRDKELVKLAAKVSQAKGCAAKTKKKLRRAEGRNKGLRTMVSKVSFQL